MSLINDLYKLQKKDIKKALDVFVSAYSDDPMMEKFMKEEDKRRAQFEVMTRFCLKYGNVVATSENIEGIMALAPYDKTMTVWRIIRSGAFLISMKISKEAKIMAVLTSAVEEAKKSLKLDPYIHLLIMGVSQEFQGKGFGGKLLRAVIEKSEAEKQPIYLETQKEENVKLYEKFGFSVKKKIILPEPLNLPMWLMVRNSN